MTRDRRVLVHPDRAAVASAVAARFITKVIDLLDAQDLVHVVLTGGRIGTAILSSINDSDARDAIDWSRVHVWWGDERWVGEGSDERNDTGARTALLDHVALNAAHVHSYPSRPPGAGTGPELDNAAQTYREALAAAAGEGQSVPTFDITFLGVGADAHIASLFPDSAEIVDSLSTVLAVRNAPKQPPERLSLSLQTLNSSDRIWLCLTGSDKASALGLALAGASPEQVPAAGAHGRKHTMFFVDADAVSDIAEDLISSEY